MFIIFGVAGVLAIAGAVWMLRAQSSLEYYAKKRVLVIGGSSGLGLALAHKLKAMGAAVTVTSRSARTLEGLRKQFGFQTLQVDVEKDAAVSSIPTEYELVFCCAGFALPSVADELSVEKVRACMETNFYGPVRVFLHFYRGIQAGERKRLVFISSTLGLRSFIGYGAYSPSKASLRSFYDSVKDEAAEKGLDLSIYYVSTINSPGLEKENLTKPEVTKHIEGASCGESATCEHRAETLLRALPKHSVVVSDVVTRLFMHSTDILSVADCLAWVVAPLFWGGFRLFCRYHIAQHFQRRKKTV